LAESARGRFDFSGGGAHPPLWLICDISLKIQELERSLMTDNVTAITSDRTAHWAENNPLCTQRRRPGMRIFPYTDML
jgi:hypothetical protein